MTYRPRPICIEIPCIEIESRQAHLARRAKRMLRLAGATTQIINKEMVTIGDDSVSMPRQNCRSNVGYTRGTPRSTSGELIRKPSRAGVPFPLRLRSAKIQVAGEGSCRAFSGSMQTILFARSAHTSSLITSCPQGCNSNASQVKSPIRDSCELLKCYLLCPRDLLLSLILPNRVVLSGGCLGDKLRYSTQPTTAFAAFAREPFKYISLLGGRVAIDESACVVS